MTHPAIPLMKKKVDWLRGEIDRQRENGTHDASMEALYTDVERIYFEVLAYLIHYPNATNREILALLKELENSPRS